MAYFKSQFENTLSLKPWLGWSLIIFFGLLRFGLVLHANIHSDYRYVSLIFMVMIILPFLLLNKKGKRLIGISRPESLKWIFYGALLGILICTLTYWTGNLLYGDSLNNWFMYISRSYGVEQDLLYENRWMYFGIFSLMGITFSPLGEELLYRGLIHECFVDKYGDNQASQIDSLAFAFAHLAHFGLLYVEGEWSFRFLPALLWIFFMFLASRAFYFVRVKTESIAGAIVAHAAFNLAMTYYIIFGLMG
ncbi:MAG TPA: CPBP family intramembrane metalloprotease [Cytophagales bacterium]|jgi:membrane protease YdiL (CAAX protease family)|nr:CPBP family intramembrane metalloprotease [Cytophagales bacterium]